MDPESATKPYAEVMNADDTFPIFEHYLDDYNQVKKDHNYIGYNYVGHNHIGHNYITIPRRL